MGKIKKICLMISILVSINLFNGCSYFFGGNHYCCYGIDKFEVAISSDGLGNIWPPYHSYDKDELFFNQLKNISSDFYYTYDDRGTFIDEKQVILYYIIYDEYTYSEAKKELFDLTECCIQHRYAYNGYMFFHNLSSDIPSSGKEEDLFCKHSHMICFNDDKNLIMALGLLYIPDSKEAKVADKTDLINTDLGAFLKEYFKYYDFDAEIPKIDADALKRDYPMM